MTQGMTPPTAPIITDLSSFDLSSLPDFKAVLWDMDGTLVSSDILHKECIQKIGVEMDKIVSDELAARALGVSHRFCYDLLTEELGTLPLDFDTWKQREFDLYLTSVHLVQPRDNVLDVVRSLYDRGIKQGIFSNNQRVLIDYTLQGFTRFFDKPHDIFSLIVSLDDVPAKPAPDGYLLAAERLGVAPQECLVIEDSPTGVKSGMAAGCFTIYWPDPNTVKTLSVQPNMIVENLDFLK